MLYNVSLQKNRFEGYHPFIRYCVLPSIAHITMKMTGIQIRHFRVAFCFWVKTSLRAKPLSYEKMCTAFIFFQIRHIFVWKGLHKDSFWNRGTRELGNDQLCSRSRVRLRSWTVSPAIRRSFILVPVALFARPWRDNRREPFVSRAKTSPAKRSQKGYRDENGVPFFGECGKEKRKCLLSG